MLYISICEISVVYKISTRWYCHRDIIVNFVLGDVDTLTKWRFEGGSLLSLSPFLLSYTQKSHKVVKFSSSSTLKFHKVVHSISFISFITSYIYSRYEFVGQSSFVSFSTTFFTRKSHKLIYLSVSLSLTH